MRTPRYSVKRTGFLVPSVPEPYKIHSMMRTLAYLSCMIVRHRGSIQQVDIIIALVRIVLASG